MCVTARDIFPGVVKKNLSIPSWSGLVEENTESRSDERVQKMELTLVNGYTISFQLAFLKPEDVGNRFAGDLIPNMSSEKRVEEFADYLM
jgi:hypothetical protein